MIASFYTGIYAILFAFLSINVIKGRRHNKILIGHNNNEDMLRRIRAQSNFLEYTLFFVVLLAFAEKNRLSFIVLNILGVLFLIGRIMHMYSLLVHEKVLIDNKVRNPRWRIRGMICSINSILFLAIFDICYPIYHFMR